MLNILILPPNYPKMGDFYLPPKFVFFDEFCTRRKFSARLKFRAAPFHDATDGFGQDGRNV